LQKRGEGKKGIPQIRGKKKEEFEWQKSEILKTRNSRPLQKLKKRKPKGFKKGANKRTTKGKESVIWKETSKMRERKGCPPKGKKKGRWIECDSDFCGRFEGAFGNKENKQGMCERRKFKLRAAREVSKK